MRNPIRYRRKKLVAHIRRRALELHSKPAIPLSLTWKRDGACREITVVLKRDGVVPGGRSLMVEVTDEALRVARELSAEVAAGRLASKGGLDDFLNKVPGELARLHRFLKIVVSPHPVVSTYEETHLRPSESEWLFEPAHLQLLEGKRGLSSLYSLAELSDLLDPLLRSVEEVEALPLPSRKCDLCQADYVPGREVQTHCETCYAACWERSPGKLDRTMLWRYLNSRRLEVELLFQGSEVLKCKWHSNSKKPSGSLDDNTYSYCRSELSQQEDTIRASLNPIEVRKFDLSVGKLASSRTHTLNRLACLLACVERPKSKSFAANIMTTLCIRAKDLTGLRLPKRAKGVKPGLINLRQLAQWLNYVAEIQGAETLLRAVEAVPQENEAPSLVAESPSLSESTKTSARWEGCLKRLANGTRQPK
jgi:hypothetical protein